MHSAVRGFSFHLNKRFKISDKNKREIYNILVLTMNILGLFSQTLFFSTCTVFLTKVKSHFNNILILHFVIKDCYPSAEYRVGITLTWGSQNWETVMCKMKYPLYQDPDIHTHRVFTCVCVCACTWGGLGWWSCALSSASKRSWDWLPRSLTCYQTTTFEILVRAWGPSYYLHNHHHLGPLAHFIDEGTGSERCSNSLFPAPLYPF